MVKLKQNAYPIDADTYPYSQTGFVGQVDRLTLGTDDGSAFGRPIDGRQLLGRSLPTGQALLAGADVCAEQRMTSKRFADRCLPGRAINMATQFELHGKRRWIAG